MPKDKGLGTFFKALTFQESPASIAFAWIGLVVFAGVMYGALGLAGVEMPQIPLLFSTAPAETGAGAQPTIISTEGTCPSTGLNTIKLKGSFDDPTTGNLDTLVATNYYIYRMSDPTTVKTSGTTLTSGYTAQVNDTVNCGESVNVFIGDGGTTYYYAKTSLSGADTNVANSYVSSKLKRSSAGTMTFSNTTTMGASTVKVAMGSGATNSDATVRVKAGSYYYGDGAFEICAQYDSANFSKVSFGSSAKPIAYDPSITASAGMNVMCYEVSGDVLYNNGYIDLPVVVQAISGVNPDANSKNVTVIINDKACYLKNGECPPSYVNTDTNADLGLGKVTSSMAIRFS